MLHPTLGRHLDGATLTSVDEQGGVGTPAWGPAGLLRDLELRLGLFAIDAPPAVRIHQWSARLAALLADAAFESEPEPFYARSFRVDPLGTAEMLLAWRDDLLDSGWDCAAIPNGGPRLHTFATLESLAPSALPLLPGSADRLASIERELARRATSPYASLTFVDAPGLWPTRWRRIFDLLAARGAAITATSPAYPGAPADSDLGRLQALISEAALAAPGTRLRGDGSLVLLRAATTLEAADAVAAIVAAAPAGSVVLIRPPQAALVLDHALAAHGAGQLGVCAASPWRAAVQALPLAIDLLFAPIDPRRALELLGLATSPFTYATRHMLSRALADSPGIGDVRWRAAKQRLYEHLAASGKAEDVAHADRELALVATWLEPTRHDPRAGAPVATIIAATTRVREWLRRRMTGEGASAVEAAALAQCDDLLAILATEPRTALDRLAVQQLLDAVTASGASAALTTEQSGRVDHVDHPGALRRARDQLIWWHCVAATARPPHRARWRATELAALAARGVTPDDPAARLADEASQWRLAVLSARRQLVLVLPDLDRGDRPAPHPLWDEIVARLRLDASQLGPLTVTVAGLHAGRHPTFDLATEVVAPLPLPPARAVWHVAPGMIAPATRLTPGDIEDLLGCPLRWVLGRAASLHSYSVPTLREGASLNGGLGHRLIEALAANGGLAQPRAVLTQTIDELLPGVAAWLLQPGLASELHQLRHQLVAAVEGLAALLARGDLTIVAIEEEIAGQWLGADLAGRLDLRLLDRAGRDLILDLKWGHGTYRDLLANGRAVQLAVYAHARRLQTGVTALPAAGYFSLGRARLLTVDRAAFGLDGLDGPTLDQTVARIAATVPVVQRVLATGDVPATGVGRSRPLLDALGVPAVDHGRHYATLPGQGCGYCRFGALCGQTWESLP